MPSYTSGGFYIFATEPLSGTAIEQGIGSIVSIDIPLNVESRSDDSGQIYDEGHAITKVEPIATVVTKAIDAVLAIVGLGGTCFIDDTDPGASIYGKKRGDCLTDVNATDHTQYLFGNGLLSLGTLQASRGDDATLSFMVDAITDGTNAPMVITHGVAIPAVTFAKGQWEIALCKIAGTVFKPTDFTINFNVSKEKPRPLAPVIWNDRIAVSKVQPTVTIRGIDPSVISAAGIDPSGDSATHLNTLLQLVKRQSGGSYVAAATTEHIGITVDGLVVVTNPFSVSGQADATVDIEIRTRHDGTNVPILIDTTWAYDSTP